MTIDPRVRASAYRDLVGGLVDARFDLASGRFDAELEAAEAAGRIDPATARVLRWWQRESVRAVTEHVRATLPEAVLSLERAAREAEESLGQADAAWRAARSAAARSAYGAEVEHPDDPGPGTDPGPTRRGRTAPSPTPSASAAPLDPDGPTTGGAASDLPRSPGSGPTAELPTEPPSGPPVPPWIAPPPPVPSRAPGRTASFTTPPTREPTSSRAVGAAVDAAGLPEHLATAAPVNLPPPPATPTEHQGDGRRRMLVAGLTVLPPDD